MNQYVQQSTNNLPLNDPTAPYGSGVNMGGGVTMQEEFNGF